MKPFEIAQKYVYGEHDALTDNQEIIDMTKDIEQAIAGQLILCDVSQQRELLIAELNKTDLEYIQQQGCTDILADDLLKAINCG